MITLYGIAASRTFRCYWMAEELGIDYQRNNLDFRSDALREPSYLAINPNGRIPALTDGDYVLWESMAINLYLASKYREHHNLWPDTLETQGLAYQWSFWVMTELEHPLLSILMHKRILPQQKRDPQKLARNEGVVKRPLEILDQALIGQDYLCGKNFTVADLNVAAVLSWSKPARFSLKPYPQLDAWLKRCLDRPARKRAQIESS